MGYRVSRDAVRGEGIPLTISGAAPTFYLGVSMRLSPDHQGDFLMVRSSAIVLATEPAITNVNMLLHYDYEREKSDGYPEAHLQICASSTAWEKAGQRHDGDTALLNKVHLPVGGRRFRPTLEDIIEFLIVEGLVKARPKWQATLEAGREGFREKQSRAAVRRYPEIARDQLDLDGNL